MKTVVEKVLNCHNAIFEIISVQSFWNFITAENKAVSNSYLVELDVYKTESMKGSQLGTFWP